MHPCHRAIVMIERGLIWGSTIAIAVSWWAVVVVLGYCRGDDVGMLIAQG